ncbi:MAG TPA: prepilin-type N-terminal cleavage/methylation domain-containing protein [Candidatus Didemnitutus sp.]
MNLALTTFVCGVRAGSRASGGFSLLELLVVLGLVAVLSVAYFNGFGGGQAAALQSAQAMLIEALLDARGRAIASGRAVRLLVSTGTIVGSPGGRFLRQLVTQAHGDDGTWIVAAAIQLPRGTALIPAPVSIPPALLSEPDHWINSRDEPLVSTALLAMDGSGLVGPYPDDVWCGIAFGPDGMVAAGGGVLVLAEAKPVSTDATCPLRCRDARSVRGVLLSRYGVPVALNGWGEF